VNGQLDGFALVSRLPHATCVETHISELFILRKYCRQGIGEAVAREVVARFPGYWSLSIDTRNGTGLRFWRTVVGRVTGGVFTEHCEPANGRIIHEFGVPAPH